MESKLQNTGWLSPDIVGFPVLEDERAFGAFRGSIRIRDSHFSIEPYTYSSTPDGCMHVDICPMVFLGRTDRLKRFEWNPNLPVGEHEYFFLANQMNGIRVVVCAAFSATHLRVDPTVVSETYKTRRARQGELMSKVFAHAGITTTLYTFRRYSLTSHDDVESLTSSNVDPLSVTDMDTGHSREILLGRKFALIAFITCPSCSAQRHQIRSSFKHLSDHISLIFLIPTGELEDQGGVDIDREMYEWNDIILIPSERPVHFVFKILRYYWFNFFIMSNEYNIADVLNQITNLQNHRMRVILALNTIAISRDIFQIISNPINLDHLRSESSLIETIAAWIRPYDINN
jgi:hypothetical protein